MNDIVKNYPDYKEIIVNKTPKDYKMYILVNSTVKLSPGKVASQVGHAVEELTRKMNRSYKKIYKHYYNNGSPKIVLQVPSEKVFIKILDATINLEKVYIFDAGHTQCKSDTLTVVGYIPIIQSPKCFSELKLY